MRTAQIVRFLHLLGRRFDDFTEPNFGLSEYTDSTGRIASLPSKSQCPRAYFPFERENMTLGKGSRFNGVFKGVS